ncbi:MAG: phosphoribosylanthranilate isomerase [Bacillota bacterium]
MKDGYRVKICGTTNMEDALISAGEGVDYIGVVIEVEFSKRSLTIEEAEGIFSNCPVPAVALVFNMNEERLHYLIDRLNPFAVQFLSQEDYGLVRYLKSTYPNTQLWQSIHLPGAGDSVDIGTIRHAVEHYIEAGIDVLLYDTVATVQGVQKFGGTGLVSDWSLVRKLVKEVDHRVPVLLAGGINPDNVLEALKNVKPDGIDLCSGVESVPGKKDPDRIKDLMKKVCGKD